MFYKALKGKIHRATVTGSTVDYPGSIGVDPGLLEAAGILPYEHVLLVNITNGARVDTYVIPAEEGSGEVNVLGAAALHFSPGHIVIIMNFALFAPEEMKCHKPKVVIPDENNKIKEVI